MCYECSLGGEQGLCPSCRALAEPGAFPFKRSDFSFGELFSYVLEAFKREWLMLSLAVLVFFAVVFAVAIVSNLVTQVLVGVTSFAVDAKSHAAVLPVLAVTLIGTVVGMVIQMVAQGFVMLGLYRMLIDVLDGRKADLARMFSQVRKLGRYVVLNLILMVITYLPVLAVLGVAFGGVLLSSGLHLADFQVDQLEQLLGARAIGLVGLAALVVLLYAIWMFPLWLFGVPELVVSEASALEALQRAWQMASGLRLTAFGYSFMAGLVMLVGVILCCVGALPAMAIAYLLNLALFLAARNDPDFSFPARE